MTTQHDERAELIGCACRWDKYDNQVHTCERHQGWLDVVHEWAERAKAAEREVEGLKISCRRHASHAASAEQQAQAGEPEVAAWIDEFGNVYPKAAKGVNAWFNAHQKSWKEVITLQSHREAIAKRDAALVACVEAMKKTLGVWGGTCAWHSDIKAAITQANEARGRKGGGV